MRNMPFLICFLLSVSGREIQASVSIAKKIKNAISSRKSAFIFSGSALTVLSILLYRYKYSDRRPGTKENAAPNRNNNNQESLVSDPNDSNYLNNNNLVKINSTKEAESNFYISSLYENYHPLCNFIPHDQLIVSRSDLIAMLKSDKQEMNDAMTEKQKGLFNAIIACKDIFESEDELLFPLTINANQIYLPIALLMQFASDSIEVFDGDVKNIVFKDDLQKRREQKLKSLQYYFSDQFLKDMVLEDQMHLFEIFLHFFKQHIDQAIVLNYEIKKFSWVLENVSVFQNISKNVMNEKSGKYAFLNNLFSWFSSKEDMEKQNLLTKRSTGRQVSIYFHYALHILQSEQPDNIFYNYCLDELINAIESVKTDDEAISILTDCFECIFLLRRPTLERIFLQNKVRFFIFNRILMGEPRWGGPLDIEKIQWNQQDVGWYKLALTVLEKFSSMCDGDSNLGQLEQYVPFFLNYLDPYPFLYKKNINGTNWALESELFKIGDCVSDEKKCAQDRPCDLCRRGQTLLFFDKDNRKYGFCDERQWNLEHLSYIPLIIRRRGKNNKQQSEQIQSCYKAKLDSHWQQIIEVITAEQWRTVIQSRKESQSNLSLKRHLDLTTEGNLYSYIICMRNKECPNNKSVEEFDHYCLLKNWKSIYKLVDQAKILSVVHTLPLSYMQMVAADLVSSGINIENINVSLHSILFSSELEKKPNQERDGTLRNLLEKRIYDKNNRLILINDLVGTVKKNRGSDYTANYIAQNLYYLFSDKPEILKELIKKAKNLHDYFAVDDGFRPIKRILQDIVWELSIYLDQNVSNKQYTSMRDFILYQTCSTAEGLKNSRVIIDKTENYIIKNIFSHNDILTEKEKIKLLLYSTYNESIYSKIATLKEILHQSPESILRYHKSVFGNMTNEEKNQLNEIHNAMFDGKEQFCEKKCNYPLFNPMTLKDHIPILYQKSDEELSDEELKEYSVAKSIITLEIFSKSPHIQKLKTEADCCK